MEVFAEKFTPTRKIRRMKSRAVRNYYHDLNDMIKKYMAIAKVEKRFEKKMRRQQSEAAEGKKAPYAWYGSEALTPGNWMSLYDSLLLRVFVFGCSNGSRARRRGEAAVQPQVLPPP